MVSNRNVRVARSRDDTGLGERHMGQRTVTVGDVELDVAGSGGIGAGDLGHFVFEPVRNIDADPMRIAGYRIANWRGAGLAGGRASGRDRPQRPGRTAPLQGAAQAGEPGVGVAAAQVPAPFDMVRKVDRAIVAAADGGRGGTVARASVERILRLRVMVASSDVGPSLGRGSRARLKGTLIFS